MVNSSLDWRVRQRSCESLNNVNVSECSGQRTGWQWTAGGVGFNLNADMSIFKYFSADADGKPSCDYQTCPLSLTARF